MPSLLPGGRPVADPAARVDVAAVWGLSSLPPVPGRDTAGIIAAAASGRLAGCSSAGWIRPTCPTRLAALAALDGATFVVSLEVRAGAVTERADVVLPVAPPPRRPGTFVDWEGRCAFLPAGPAAQRDERPAGGRRAGRRHGRAARAARGRASARRARRAGRWEGDAGGRTRACRRRSAAAAAPGTAVLATWHLLLDEGRLQDGEPYLAGTRHVRGRPASLATAVEIGAVDGGG